MSATRKVRRASQAAPESRDTRGRCPHCGLKIVGMSGPGKDGSFVTTCPRNHTVKVTPDEVACAHVFDVSPDGTVACKTCGALPSEVIA